MYTGLEINDKNFLYDTDFTENGQYSEQKFKDNIEQNYQKFAKYRMIFEKDDDSLYKFKNIEKVD